MPTTVITGTVEYRGIVGSGAAGYVPPGQSRFRIYDSLKIKGADGQARTLDTISILTTAEPEVQPGSTGSFIISEGHKVKVLIGIVKADGVYNYTARVHADTRKAKTVGMSLMFGGICGLVMPPIGLFLIWRALPFFRFPKVGVMTDAELVALVG